MVMVLSSVYSITLRKNLATIEDKPRIINKPPQNLAKNIVMSIITPLLIV